MGLSYCKKQDNHLQCCSYLWKRPGESLQLFSRAVYFRSNALRFREILFLADAFLWTRSDLTKAHGTKKHDDKHNCQWLHCHQNCCSSLWHGFNQRRLIKDQRRGCPGGSWLHFNSLRCRMPRSQLLWLATRQRCHSYSSVSILVFSHFGCCVNIWPYG